MRKIREVLRLSHGSLLSRRAVAASLGISRDAVADYLLRAASAGLTFMNLGDAPDDERNLRVEVLGWMPRKFFGDHNPDS